MRASLKRHLVLLIRSFCIFCCFCGCPVVIFMTFHIILLFGSLWLPLKWILSFSSPPAGQNMSLLFSPSSVLFAIKLSRFVKYMSQANARTAALCARLLKCAAQRGSREVSEWNGLSLYVSVCVCVWSCHKMLSVSFTRRSMPERAGAAIWLNSCLAAWQLGKTNCRNNCGKAEFTTMFRLYNVFGQITHLMH